MHFESLPATDLCSTALSFSKIKQCKFNIPWSLKYIYLDGHYKGF